MCFGKAIHPSPSSSSFQFAPSLPCQLTNAPRGTQAPARAHSPPHLAKASLADPSTFALSLAVGCTHILDSLPGFLHRAGTRSPVLAVLLALPVHTAYLAFVTLAFAFRVAADCYARIVVACGDDAATAAQQAAATILGWFADMIVRLAVPALLFSAVAFACALLHFSSVRCSQLTAGD